MLAGLILTAFGNAFRELSTSIGKYEVEQKKESVYTMGFLGFFWGTIIFFVLGFIIRDSFVFSFASLPTFGARLILEIILMYIAVHAVVHADRSTFGFLRIWTIPLLLVVDIFLGYEISTLQVIGISLIVLSFIFLFINHGIKKKGALLTLLTAIIAVATISLYKYNITHFNSVEAEQGITFSILMLCFFFSAYYIKKENPLRFLTQKIFFAQSFTRGISSIFFSFALVFAPASLLITAKRSFSILASVLSGHYYFKEKHFVTKLVSYLLITAGIILLII